MEPRRIRASAAGITRGPPLSPPPPLSLSLSLPPPLSLSLPRLAPRASRAAPGRWPLALALAAGRELLAGRRTADWSKVEDVESFGFGFGPRPPGSREWPGQPQWPVASGQCHLKPEATWHLAVLSAQCERTAMSFAQSPRGCSIKAVSACLALQHFEN
jgi:hypothetical protein